MATLRLALLGPPSVIHADVPTQFPTRKALALLVYLAVEGGRHSRDKLAAIFWPDSDRSHGRAMLRYTLTGLRRALSETTGSAHLIVQGDAISLDLTLGLELDLRALEIAQLAGPVGAPASDTSTAALTTLRQAAKICRGEFLEGFALPDAPAFDDWAGLQREAWQQKMEYVLGGLSQLQAECGHLAEAAETARQWVALSPLSEDAHRRLMEVHLAAGDRSAALRAFDTCRAMLDQELHVVPAPETEALAERIRRADPSGDRVRRGPGAVQSPGMLLESPLVGRTDEFLQLVECYHATRQGSA